MATNHTTNYQLNLWEPTDRFLRTEFNENAQKIDAALKAEADARSALAAAKADASAVTALTQTVNGKADASTVTALSQTVSTKADASAVTALTQTVAGKGNCSISTGSYTGNGKYGKNNPNSLHFSGGLPKLLIITGPAKFLAHVLILTPGVTLSYPVENTKSEMFLTWGTNSVSWYCEYSAEFQMNFEGTTYHYVTFV